MKRPAKPRKRSRKPPDPAGAPPASTPHAGALAKAPADVDAERAARIRAIPGMHTPVVGRNVYRSQLGDFSQDAALHETSLDHVAHSLRRMATRGPAGGDAHRPGDLDAHPPCSPVDPCRAQTGVDQVRVMNEACERAAGTYRKLMLALADYRRPPRPDGPVTIQTNVAHNQLVTHGTPAAKQIPSNEQGSSRPPQALLPHTVGAGFAAPISGGESAVVLVNRAADAGG